MPHTATATASGAIRATVTDSNTHQGGGVNTVKEYVLCEVLDLRCQPGAFRALPDFSVLDEQ